MKIPLRLSCLIFFSACSIGPPEPPAEKAVQVQVTRAHIEQVERTIEAPATLFPVREIQVSSTLTATIRRLPVQPGDVVGQGELLVQLEDRDLKAAQRESAAGVAEAEANLRRLQAGTLPAEMERVQGQLRSAEATLHQAEQIHARRAELAQEGAIPQREELTARTDLEKAQADYAYARKALDVLVATTQQQDLEMARLQLEKQRARAEFLDAQVSFTRLTAPFGGTVTAQAAYPGDVAQPGASLVTLSDLSTVVARAQVPESKAARIMRDQPCRFESSDSSGLSLLGRVSVINRSVDALSRTVEVWCRIPQPGERVRGGLYGRLSIITATDDVLLVPRSAIQLESEGGHGTAAVVDSNQVARQQAVEAGDVFGDAVEVLTGLTAGDTVVVEGGYGLPDGTRVEVPKAVGQ